MLFEDAAVNLLPYDGIINDYGLLYGREAADAYLAALLAEIPWRHDEVVIYGRRIRTARQVAWYGERDFAYTYSGATRTALAWTERLLAIKARVEAQMATVSPVRFNACLLNLYADGSQGMAWHSDDEGALVAGAPIASLSFGAARTFAFRHKASGESRKMELQHGQLMVMRGDTQRHWQHAVMKSARVKTPRVSLTFRVMKG